MTEFSRIVALLNTVVANIKILLQYEYLQNDFCANHLLSFLNVNTAQKNEVFH